MPMIEYYPQIKLLHMSCAWLSISGFVLRGVGALAEASWLQHRAARIVPMSVDTLLILTALTLASLSGQWPFAQAWLGAKVTALLVYILLGMVALHWGRNPLQKGLAFGAALLCFAYILGVATTRSVMPF
jgi:uncharacterized membrane protein SirB2